MQTYFSQETVLWMMEQAVDAAGGQDAYAAKVGVHTRQIEHLLKRKRNPRGKVLADLNLKTVVVYVPVSP